MNFLTMKEEDILRIVVPIMDNLTEGSRHIDHEPHTRDFTARLKTIVTKEKSERICEDYQEKLGYFPKREFLALFR